MVHLVFKSYRHFGLDVSSRSLGYFVSESSRQPSMFENIFLNVFHQYFGEGGVSMVTPWEKEGSIYGQFQGLPAITELLMKFKDLTCRMECLTSL